MKFCKDCKYLGRERNYDYTITHMCRRPSSNLVDPVLGNVVATCNRTCKSERKYGWPFGDSRCGPDATFFIPRQAPQPPQGGSGVVLPNNKQDITDKKLSDVMADFIIKGNKLC